MELKGIVLKRRDRRLQGPLSSGSRSKPGSRRIARAKNPISAEAEINILIHPNRRIGGPSSQLTSDDSQN